MKRLASAALTAALLAACAAPPLPPGTQADEARIARAVVPGQSTRESVRAALGATRSIAFDSGFEVWLYQIPKGGGLFSEYVILFDRNGVVSKTRQRAPAPVPAP